MITVQLTKIIKTNRKQKMLYHMKIIKVPDSDNGANIELVNDSLVSKLNDSTVHCSVTYKG
jgi:hypothetical protein